MIAKLESIRDRFLTIEEQISDPQLMSDMDRYAKLNKEYVELRPFVEILNKYKITAANAQNAKEIISAESDAELRELAKEELNELLPEIDRMEEEIKMMLIPKDPEDTKDAIFEIRSGTGGDEASIFAGDLYRMYTKYFDTKGWKYEALSVNEGTQGGYNKVELEVTGDNVFGMLKFESGAHRVQRIPKTESQGRVHTSAATVVVMPILEFEDVDINKADIKTDTFRASGAGGQHVNKTESGVRFTHLPTGIVAESTEARSQIKNREIAMSRLIAEIQKEKRDKVFNEQAAIRKSLVGSGDRSDKIRTYNYPQNRLTDHRINLTLYNLDSVMEGNINDIIEALRLYENTQKLQTGSDD
ncbi:MAG: peptide chain release factor 1 [Saprospiraceae bacterium]|jgi:peptide chain release factor 1|nr:peptide chain release factor 1 [Saprospiraceae bacterium]